MPELSIALMGPCQVRLDGQEVAGFQSNKVRGLLAYLAVEGDRAHSREALAGLLWPDYPNPAALTYLRNALSNLRQVIGDDKAKTSFLIISRETIQLNPASEVQVDLHSFERLINELNDLSAEIAKLQSALALYRGPFLDGLSCDSSVFEEWTLCWRERLNRRFRETLARLSSAYAQLGKHEQSIQAARQLLELEPWDEPTHRLLIQELARNGQRGAALAQYETCRRLLRDELGIEPDAETKAVVENIRGGLFRQEFEGTTPGEIPRSAAQSRLPSPLTHFIGRERELGEIERLLGHPRDGIQAGVGKARLVTLTGAGGCGKTRLAIAAAHRLAAAGTYAQGVGWVDLSPIADPEQVTNTAVAALGLPVSDRTPAVQILANYLRDRELLLVLDNCEHLVEAIARLAESLLETCPGLQILATSRVPLNLPGEVLWRVPGLGLPDMPPGRGLPASELIQYDAVRLFGERARAVAPDWQFEENAEGAASICTRLDGIPLAIELAAAQVRMMTIEQIQARLGDIFHLLTGGSRTSLRRHQTLRACIDWSYSLLATDEQTLLRQLSVFSGGWVLEAVEWIGKDRAGQEQTQADALDLLARLIDHSLVMVDQDTNWGMRYRLLETIRQYAQEKLVEAAEEDQARNRHLVYFRDFALRAKAELRGPDQVRWHGLVGSEMTNIRAALEWSLKVDPASGLSITSNLMWFWNHRNLWLEACNWLELALEADAACNPADPENHPEHARIRGWAIDMYCWGRFETGPQQITSRNPYISFSRREELWQRIMHYAKEGLDLFQRLPHPDRSGIASMQNYLAWPFSFNARDKALLAEFLAVYREEGNKFLEANTLTDFINCVVKEKDYHQAEHLYDDHLVLRKEIGDIEGIAWGYFEKGLLEANHLNNYPLADQCFAEALRIFQHLDNHLYTRYALQQLAILAWKQKDIDRAIITLDRSLVASRQYGYEGSIADTLRLKARLLADFYPGQALMVLREAHLLFRKIGYDGGTFQIATCLSYLNILQGHFERAARLLGVLPRSYTTPLKGIDWVQICEERLLSALGEQAYAKTRAEGEAMTLEQAIEFVSHEIENMDT